MSNCRQCVREIEINSLLVAQHQKGQAFMPQEQSVSARHVPTANYQATYGIQVVVQELKKLHELKINKVKGGYLARANFIFQSWLKDIWVNVKERLLTQRKAKQLIKDFTAEHTHNKLEFYMGMVAEEEKTFEGPANHLRSAFHSGKTTNDLIPDFYGQSQKKYKL